MLSPSAAGRMRRVAVGVGLLWLGVGVVGCARGCGDRSRIVPATLRVPVELEGREVGVIDGALLERTPPDYAADDRRAWRLETLLGPRYGRADLLLEVESTEGPRVVVGRPVPNREGRVPILEVNRKGVLTLAVERPDDPFPAFHERGGNRGRPGDHVGRIRDLTRLRFRVRPLPGTGAATRREDRAQRSRPGDGGGAGRGGGSGTGRGEGRGSGRGDAGGRGPGDGSGRLTRGGGGGPGDGSSRLARGGDRGPGDGSGRSAGDGSGRGSGDARGAGDGSGRGPGDGRGRSARRGGPADEGGRGPGPGDGSGRGRGDGSGRGGGGGGAAQSDLPASEEAAGRTDEAHPADGATLEVVVHGEPTHLTMSARDLATLPRVPGDARAGDYWSLRDVVAKLVGPDARVAELGGEGGRRVTLDAGSWRDPARVPALRLNRRGLLKFEWVEPGSLRTLPGAQLRGVQELGVERAG